MESSRESENFVKNCHIIFFWNTKSDSRQKCHTRRPAKLIKQGEKAILRITSTPSCELPELMQLEAFRRKDWSQLPSEYSISLK